MSKVVVVKANNTSYSVEFNSLSRALESARYGQHVPGIKRIVVLDSSGKVVDCWLA